MEPLCAKADPEGCNESAVDVSGSLFSHDKEKKL